MAPKNARNGHHSKVCNNGDAQPSRRDALDEDAIALESAQNELKAVSQSVEQLLEVMRTGNGEQLEALVAATRSGVPQEEILAMVRQYTQEKERTVST